jgi:Zn-dependent metalloprotease
LFENRSGILLDFLSILDFGIYSIILIFLRGSLFVELSPVSIDNFMQELDDIVLIFEKDKKLIDTNKKARETFPFLHDGLMINEFLKKLKIMTISKKPVGQNEEIALSLPNGIRYYQFDKTQVKDKKGNSQATVLIFHDITEESLLEKELACKNAEVAKLNIRLKAFLDTAEKLIEEEQKAKAEKEIKEMLGIKIKNLLSDIELISHNSEYEKLPGLIEDCRDLMAGVRLALQKLIKKAGEDEIDD